MSIVSTLRKALGAASLRTRVLIATCLVVAAALAIMGFAGTFLLHGYLISRDDAQLRAFAALTAKNHALRPHPRSPRLPHPGDIPLPSAFLIAPGHGCAFHIWLPLAASEPDGSVTGTGGAGDHIPQKSGVPAPKPMKEIA